MNCQSRMCIAWAVLGSAGAAIVSLPQQAAGDPTVPGVTTRLYSQLEAGHRPYTLALDASGVLYVSSDNNAIEGRFILSVPVGGGSPLNFSTERIYDPDGVIVDRTGSYSGVAGAVLVGCSDTSGATGRIRAVRPDGTNFTVAGPSTELNNNDTMAFDSLGRLYIDVYGNRTVARMNGSVPTAILTLPPGVSGGVIEIDHLDRLWIACTDGNLRRYSLAGVLEATIRVSNASLGMGRSDGGLFERGIYVIDRQSGILSRVNAQDGLEAVGSGFGEVYHAVFDASGAMYVAEYESTRVWKLGGCPADFNGDQFVDFFDYLDFVTAFETGGGLEADFNGDGFVDFFDYSDFVAAFEVGC